MYKKVGIRIKNRRKQLDMTQRDLSQKTKVSVSFLSDIETGRSYPSLETLAEIAKALDVTISFLLGEKGEQELVEEAKEHQKTYEKMISNLMLPNGMTYKEMQEKIKLLEELEKGNKNDNSDI